MNRYKAPEKRHPVPSPWEVLFLPSLRRMQALTKFYLSVFPIFFSTIIYVVLNFLHHILKICIIIGYFCVSCPMAASFSGEATVFPLWPPERLACRGHRGPRPHSLGDRDRPRLAGAAHGFPRGPAPARRPRTLGSAEVSAGTAESTDAPTCKGTLWLALRPRPWLPSVGPALPQKRACGWPGTAAPPPAGTRTPGTPGTPAPTLPSHQQAPAHHLGRVDRTFLAFPTAVPAVTSAGHTLGRLPGSAQGRGGPKGTTDPAPHSCCPSGLTGGHGPPAPLRPAVGTGEGGPRGTSGRPPSHAGRRH